MRPLPCLLWMYDEHDFASEGRGREITRGTRLKKELELLSYVCSLAFASFKALNGARAHAAVNAFNRYTMSDGGQAFRQAGTSRLVAAN